MPRVTETGYEKTPFNYGYFGRSNMKLVLLNGSIVVYYRRVESELVLKLCCHIALTVDTEKLIEGMHILKFIVSSATICML